MSTETHNNAHALDVLKRYNAWRRASGVSTMDDYELSPREIGQSIDIAIAVLSERVAGSPESNDDV